jgi:hypothetical protein
MPSGCALPLFGSLGKKIHVLFQNKKILKILGPPERYREHDKVRKGDFARGLKAPQASQRDSGKLGKLLLRAVLFQADAAEPMSDIKHDVRRRF